MSNLVLALDLLGIAVFAVSGSMVASRRQMDLIGFGLMASVTGVGGGTLRDVLLDRPVFWVHDPLPIALCLAVAVVVYFTAHVFDRRYRVLLWADAMGLSLFAVLGAELARQTGAGPLVSIVMGLMTATFGGLIRDVICHETPLILRKEVYATCAALSAATHVLLVMAGMPEAIAAAAGFTAGFALRAAGIRGGVSLPTYRGRPGRRY